MAPGLLYKEDWEETKQRYRAWWAGEVLDRVALAVIAPRRAVVPPEPRDDEARYTDAEYLIEYCDRTFAATFFGGEAVPSPVIMLGYTLYGGTAHFAPDTIWMDPIFQPYDDLASFQFDWSGRWWVANLELCRRLAQAARGKYLVGLSAFMPPTDILSLYLGPQQLCLELLERGEQLRMLQEQLMGVWKGTCQAQWRAVGAAEQGYTGWLTLWSPTPYAPLQCDFSCMISKPMFDEFVAPEVQECAAWLDHSIYHLDGPGALHHLDTLLSIPELGGIQWTPGAGNPGALDWIPMLRRVQSAGKLLQIDVEPSEVERALEVLRPEGLFIGAYCGSEAEARELLQNAKRWTRARR